MTINIVEIAGNLIGCTLLLWAFATIQLKRKADKQKRQVEAMLQVLPPVVSFEGHANGFAVVAENEAYIEYFYGEDWYKLNGSVVKLDY